MYEVTPVRVLALLLFYAALFVVIRTTKKQIEPAERRTFFSRSALPGQSPSLWPTTSSTR
jgi:hypothetical protein